MCLWVLATFGSRLAGFPCSDAHSAGCWFFMCSWKPCPHYLNVAERLIRIDFLGFGAMAGVGCGLLHRCWITAQNTRSTHT
ncbi:hypothetical protein ASPSYDRAFT_328630 [Aspergillus sydowii CBS 593.65]|uniref:Uncharacterized protein n=1 Tax=Aspergillus sydowii CBS 593.65 TaxID=1036612 RepID=A0A1L9TYI8_9EURO|nr:uncharacterized protein ASPSYDRAFT_328630 [Aspergillus sydowii CBS 593.65]OJJ64501.1 hypothetical protein ASPSYDRAFT_328630 [Aspergillus sydowii CBS 593.65]